MLWEGTTVRKSLLGLVGVVVLVAGIGPAAVGATPASPKPTWVYGTLVSLQAPTGASVTWSSPDAWADGHGYGGSRVEVRLTNGILRAYTLESNAAVGLQGDLVVFMSGAPVRFLLDPAGKAKVFEELAWPTRTTNGRSPGATSLRSQWLPQQERQSLPLQLPRR